MVEIKKISEEEFKDIASKVKANSLMLAKDYYLTVILYLIKDVEGLYFKGGTALQKTLLNYSRLSEDIDFTLTKDINPIKKQITQILENSGFFEKITQDKSVDDFTRLEAHYTGFFGEKDKVFIDLNKRAKLLKKPEKQEINHYYKDFIPKFSINTLSKQELIAEKITAAICRNKPRDHFDVFEIIQNKHPINLKLVKKKCELQGKQFSIPKMFKNANKLKNRWDKDLTPLLNKEASFEQVMKTLAKHFKLKEAKKKAKKPSNN